MKLIFLISLLLLSYSLINAAPNSVTLSFNPSTISAQKGKEYSIVLMVDPGNYGISGGEIQIKGDPSAISFTSVDPGGLLGNNPITGINMIDSQNGTVVLAIARIGPTTKPTPSGNMLTVKFTVPGTAKAGTYQITITQVGLADSEINDIPTGSISLANCVITIAETSSISLPMTDNPYTLALIVVAILAIVIVVLLRRKRKTQTQPQSS
jgi:ABC-type Fe3+-siderophore transport system permease subunit